MEANEVSYLFFVLRDSIYDFAHLRHACGEFPSKSKAFFHFAPLRLKAKILVRCSLSSIFLCSWLRAGRVYSGTRMDTIWAFRQGFEDPK